MVAKPVAATLERALEALSESQTRTAVMGGFAVAIWGHPRSTRDIDLLVDIPAHEREKVIGQLAARGFRAKRDSAIVQVEGGELLQLLYAPPDAFLDIQADLFLAETEFQRSALSRRVAMPAASLSENVFVVTCEDLIVFKLLAGRILDRVDAVMLLKSNRVNLDMTYLALWINKLNLQSEWREIERDAGE
jgi:hypothetical protein